MLELMIFGLFHENDWDLTQPQAVLIGAVASGCFLVGAAWIAFHGQERNRIEERQRHSDQLQVQREGWAADSKAASDRAYREEVRETYRAVLRSVREVHFQTLAFNRAKEDPSNSGRVNEIKLQIKSSMEELMALDEEMSLVNTDSVEAAFRSAYLQIMINGGMTPDEPAMSVPSPKFDFFRGEVLIKELTLTMRSHLDALRPS
ncbi:hypothetical protein ACWFNS_07560 [Oerskovia enterophila]